MNQYVPVLVALQFAAFGWRINREISVGDQNRRTWFPIPDFFNIAGLIATVSFGVVLPMCGVLTHWTTVELAAAYVFIAMHPINEAAHYRLFSREGRSIYIVDDRGDYPYVTGQEALTEVLTIFLAAGIGYFAYKSAFV